MHLLLPGHPTGKTSDRGDRTKFYVPKFHVPFLPPTRRWGQDKTEVCGHGKQLQAQKDEITNLTHTRPKRRKLLAKAHFYKQKGPCLRRPLNCTGSVFHFCLKVTQVYSALLVMKDKNARISYRQEGGAKQWAHLFWYRDVFCGIEVA